MRDFLRAIALSAMLVFLLAFVVGCVPGGLLMTDSSNMTPEQMDAYQRLGYDAIRCPTVQGPPGGGTVTSVTVPKERKAVVKFVGCQVQSIEVGN